VLDRAVVFLIRGITVVETREEQRTRARHVSCLDTEPLGTGQERTDPKQAPGAFLRGADCFKKADSTYGLAPPCHTNQYCDWPFSGFF